jgi:hypothetical protein
MRRRKFAVLTITVSVTQAQWETTGDALNEVEREIDAAFDKLLSYAQQLLGDEYHVA